jgi:hypothetical protein
MIRPVLSCGCRSDISPSALKRRLDLAKCSDLRRDLAARAYLLLSRKDTRIQ